MVNWKKVAITTALGAGSGASIGLLRAMPSPEYGYGHPDFWIWFKPNTLAPYFLIHTLPGALMGALIGIAMGD